MPLAVRPVGSTGIVYWTCSGRWCRAAHCSVSLMAWLRRLMPAVLVSELASTSMSSLVTWYVEITDS